MDPLPAGCNVVQAPGAYECVAQATTVLPDRSHPMGAGVLAVSWWAPVGSGWLPPLLLPAPDELHIVLTHVEQA